MNQPAPARFKVFFETTKGDFVVEVDTALAPIGARRFYNLVRNSYYDSVRFFRVVPDFVVQLGIGGEPAVAAACAAGADRDDPPRASNMRAAVTFANPRCGYQSRPATCRSL